MTHLVQHLNFAVEAELMWLVAIDSSFHEFVQSPFKAVQISGHRVLLQDSLLSWFSQGSASLDARKFSGLPEEGAVLGSGCLQWS